jgi:hypothetical protein
LEAVATDTPARSATSRMVGALPIDRSPPGVADTRLGFPQFLYNVLGYVSGPRNVKRPFVVNCAIGFDRESATVSRWARRQESGGSPRRMRAASATVCRPIS